MFGNDYSEDQVKKDIEYSASVKHKRSKTEKEHVEKMLLEWKRQKLKEKIETSLSISK